MISLLAAHSRRRLAAVREDGDRGSLVLAMLVTLVATTVAAVVLPLFVSSANAARYDDRRTRQLSAAQSGVETVLARIRAAADGTSSGLIGSLPCGTMIGSVLGSTTLRYRAVVQYFNQDPATPGVLGNPLALVKCVTGIGTPVVPGYARITGWGTDTPGTSWTNVAQRNVSATYVVKATNSNIVGGLFRVNKLPTSTDLCLDAGSATPTAGTPVKMKPCDSSLAAQKWAYNATLTVSLVATRRTDAAGTVTSDGLCVDGGNPETSGVALVLQPCGTTANLTQQQWNMNDWAGMQGTRTDGSDLNSLCWTVISPNVAGSGVALTGTCSPPGGSYDNAVSWQPEAAVGAGRSGATYNELVNYAQFGRCLDVTDQDPSRSFLIAWPCKQNPDPTKVTWNQRWALPALVNGVGKGRITTTKDGTTYCLTSPMSSAAGTYVRVSPCPAGPTDATTWTVRTKVATYAASYQIEDTSNATGPGLCMQVTDPKATPPDLFDKGTGISKIVVAACTASTLQKWNAPPNVDAPSLKDQTEN